MCLCFVYLKEKKYFVDMLLVDHIRFLTEQISVSASAA